MLSDQERKELRELYMLPHSKETLDEFASVVLAITVAKGISTEDAFNEAIILVQGILNNKEANGDKDKIKNMYDNFSALMDELFRK